MFDKQKLIDAVVEGEESQVTDLVKSSLEQGIAASAILNEGLIAAMDLVGELMEEEEIFIPEVLMAAKAMSAGVEIIKPLLGEDSQLVNGKVVIGTVQGDLHDIGKNLVAMMIEGSGVEVENLGVNVSVDAFIDSVKNNNANVVCMSALLTTTMPIMQQTIEALESNGLRDKVKVLVGGASVTQSFADQIGADGYAPDAGAAAKLVKSMLTA
ncbi:MAG: corrinoid protein [Proteobacteria bacterium]|nr:corrinoid protein [Pseudomonadota bacterium]